MVKIDASEYDANWITDEQTPVESAPPEEADEAEQQGQAESGSDTPTETEQQAKQAVEALKTVLNSDTGSRNSTAKSGGADNSALSGISEKAWIPYRGPEGGEGWQNAQNPEDIRYVNDPPGEVAEGYEDVADEWGSDNGESWTQEDKVAFLQDAITGLEEMRNSGLWNENVNYDDVSAGSAVGVMNIHTGFETQPAIVESVDWDANTMEVTYQDGEVEAARLGDVAFTYNAGGSDVAQQTAEDITSQLSETDDPFTAIESALPERLRNRFVDAADGHDDPLEALDTFIEEHANDWQVGRTQTLSDVSEGLAEQGHYPDRGEAVSGFGVELPAEDTTFEDGLNEVLSKNFEFARDRTIALQRYVKDRINRDDMDVPDVDAQSQRSFVRTLKSAHDTGMLDSIRKVEREENVSKRGESFAWCAGDSITIKNNLTNENVREYHENGIAVAETAGGILIHEIAHSLHDTQIRDESDTPDDVLELGVKRYTLGDPVSEEGVESEVSQYATANYAEFVAEVFTGLVKGEEYSDTVMDKYQNVHGPPLEEVEQFREGMDTLELSEDNEFIYPDYLPKPLADEARAIHDLNGGASVKSVSKNWIPYVGPQGGEGWQDTQDPNNIRYQTDAPGEVAAGYDDEHWSRDQRAVSEPDHELGYVSDENGPTLNVTTASEAESLAEAGASEGASARHMHVATWRDSDEAVTHRAFVTNYGPDMERNRTGEKPLLGERAVAADSFLRNLGFSENLPNHFLNRQQRYLAVESVPGKEVREAPDEWKQNVDEERAKDFAAAVMIAGNSDLHSKNLLLDEDGTFYAVDVDKSAGDFENGPTRFKNRGVTSIKYALRDMGIEVSRGELAKRVETVATRYDAADALEDVPNSMWSDKDRHQFRENIRTNLEVAQEGRLL